MTVSPILLPLPGNVPNIPGAVMYLNKIKNEEVMFTGCSISGDILGLMAEKVIGRTGLMILMTIAQGTKKNGEGCVLSDEQLVAWVGKSQKTIRAVLDKLTDMGMIFSLSVDGKRFLETIWSRDADEVERMKDANYKELLRKGLREARAKFVEFCSKRYCE